MSTSPHITEPFSPLEEMALRAIRRFGEMAASTVDAETMLMFIDFGNEIIDELHSHPYWDKAVVLPYYVHQSDARAIPDHILSSGLLAKFAIQQRSKKAEEYEARFLRSVNLLLLQKKWPSLDKIELGVVDVAPGTPA